MTDRISKHCEPCSNGRNLSIDATHYCKECEESYCESCSLAHKAQKVTKNHNLANIDDYLDNTASLSLNCEPCSVNGETVAAVSTCIECAESYCENCARIHKSQKATRNHKITTLVLEEKRSVCEACSYSGVEDRPSSALCLECDEALCFDCTRAHKSQKATRTHQIKHQQDGNMASPRLESGRTFKARGTFCDHCNEHNKVTILDEAFWFCFSCRKILCEKCAIDHEGSVEGSTHRLIYSLEEEKSDESQTCRGESPKCTSYISDELENTSTPAECTISSDQYQEQGSSTDDKAKSKSKEMYIEESDRTNTIQTANDICQLCEGQESPVVAFCFDCLKTMCENCQYQHTVDETKSFIRLRAGIKTNSHRK